MSSGPMTRRQKRPGSAPWRAARDRQYALFWRVALIVVGIGVITIFLLQLTVFSRPALATTIVGKWVNSQGGVMTFDADGTGFIPGVEGQTPAIPATTFTYSVPDATHLRLLINGQPIIIEVKVEGDQLTWVVDLAHNLQNVYTRAR
jgi:hypothetical protein